MSEVIPFEEEAGREPGDSESFRLDLEGYEGPIDVLLQLARDQKVDITRLSILELAEQYLEFVRRARKLRLELAADYLVMAAWLAYLKSRLLIPSTESDEEPSGAEMAAALKFQLQRLEAMQDAGARLLARSQLGQEVFARGQPEPLRRLTHASYEATLFELLSAYVRNHARVEATSLQIAPLGLYSVEEALQRLSGLMGPTPNWRTLATFLPSDLQGGLLWRSAMASTLAASLEMCREGKLQIRQDGPFGQIYLRGVAENP
jgi:segregation and condensation protein A